MRSTLAASPRPGTFLSGDLGRADVGTRTCLGSVGQQIGLAALVAVAVARAALVWRGSVIWPW